MIEQCFDPRPADELDPENWWGAIDGEILDRLREHGSATVNELSRELGLSEGAATAFLAMLAREGKARILQVELVACRPATDAHVPPPRG
jgi:predicted transcriptional regulator